MIIVCNAYAEVIIILLLLWFLLSSFIFFLLLSPSTCAPSDAKASVYFLFLFSHASPFSGALVAC